MKRTFSVVAIMAILCLCAGASDWSPDVEKTRKEAKEKKQKLILVLIGDNWGDNSIQLSKILEDAKFLEALKGYRKVKMALCQDPSKLDASVNEQLKDLIVEFEMMTQSVRLPILILFDDNGRAICLMQYVGGSVDDMVGNVAKVEMSQKIRDTMLKMSEIAPTPEEKAKLIDKALRQACSMTPLVGYDDLVEKLIEIDKDGQMGLRLQYEPAYLFRKITFAIHKDRPADIRKYTDVLISKYQEHPGVLQAALYYRGISYWIENDKEKAITDLTEAVKVDPLSENAISILSTIEMMKKKKESKQ